MKARKIIIPVSIVAGIAVIGAAVVAMGNAASAVTYAETVMIEQKSLENKISVGGTVESSNTSKVYSKLAAYTVETVNVEVGDAVKKGDVLCTIDTEELQQQILQQQATVESSGVNTDYNLSEAERQYNEALEKYENGENNAVVSAKRAIEQAQKNLDEAKRQESFGKDTALPSNLQTAEASLENAKAAYETSADAYDKAVKELEPENYPANVRAVYDSVEEYKEYLNIVEKGLYNKELEEAKGKYKNAKAAYETAKAQQDQSNIEELTEAYTAAKQQYEALAAKYDKDNLKEQIEGYENQLKALTENLETVRDNAKTALESAERAYNTALENYDVMKDQNNSTEENYGIAVKNAMDALEQAENDYDRVVAQAESELASLKKQAEKQRTVSGLNDPQVIMLQNLKDKLEYAVVTAPCDGVVTAVNAEEGAAAAGALFVIEDLSSLKITSSVGEYDIPYVGEGMSATIRCDALDGAEYSGKVTDVAPTSISSGAAAGSASGVAVNYKIETEVDGEDGKLLVGMNTKVDIISERRENALTITYDALTTDENGGDAVYIAEKDENGVWHAKLVPVKIGLETDYEIEVISDSLSAGMLVLTNTTMLTDGAVVNINENSNNETEQVTE